ncbi:hypothetical protein GRX03_15765 [Halovenus sp. WSH3]|uniref:L-alanine-DL-glutamate epimerase n=1 Tax=Halovenus carboxidivorans TaxID=2692199 RepID=A0A6B0T4K3_9EURY|nr:hypothetical protein [Halovenus carboxidivorans]MXR53055.1 hypothetical protein [Halovenus carboxidivorans]
MSLYDRLADLSVDIDGYDLELRERDTSSGFLRTSTIISLHGDGDTGRGEDVTYDNEPHHELVDAEPDLPLGEASTFDEFSELIGELDLFVGGDPEDSIYRSYRRWGFESAALDLALKQAGTDLATALDREYSPVRFVASTRLGEPPTTDRVEQLLADNPDLQFKLDPTEEWTAEIVDRLAEMDAVRTLDLKGVYEGTDVDQSGDPELYGMLLEAFPEAIIEDPDLNEETRPLFDGERDRVSWDVPITGVDSVTERPWEPDWLNIKPSRFGSVESLLSTVEYCDEHSIRMYGGGQFELGVGRQHLHALASLFYPDAPNDVAPRGYNDPDPESGLPRSPLSPPTDPTGLEWE